VGLGARPQVRTRATRPSVTSQRRGLRESVTLVHDTALRTERELAAALLDDDLVRALLTAVTASR
jgi:hypothetical protein